MLISAIAAIQKKDRGLGFNNELLFQIKDDLRRFRDITKGKPIIMGRKTWESLPLHPLPHRFNIIVTKNTDFSVPEGAFIANSIEEAIKIAQQYSNEEICIIGGGEVYRQALSFCDRLYLTIVDGDKEADAFFPDYGMFTKIIEKEPRSDEETGLEYTYLTLEK